MSEADKITSELMALVDAYALECAFHNEAEADAKKAALEQAIRRAVDWGPALTREALMFDPSGEDPNAEEVSDAWEAAMDAHDKCMHPMFHGFSEWMGRTQAACAVLIERLPPLYARSTKP